MAMYKAASELIVSADEHDEVVMLPLSVLPEQGEDIVFFTDESPAEVELVDEPKEEYELSFTLPLLPGAPDDVVEIKNDEVEVKDDKKEDDKAKATEQVKDLAWMKHYLDNIPKHKGETLGIERAKAYLTRGINHLSKMIQEDHDGKIDISKAEDARIEIENGIERLEKELAKRKKKANEEKSSITKEAGGPTIGGIIITVPLKISRIARVCINASVSSGRDIEDMVKKQADKWNLSDDEKADLVQLIQDMGFVLRRDRGLLIDDKDPYNYTSVNNFDYMANYPA